MYGKMIKKRITFYIIVIITLLFSCISMPERIQKNCLKGVVTEKKKLILQHGVMEVSFNNSCESSFIYLYVFDTDKEFWNYLSVGDSLFKEKGTFLIEVKNQNESKWFTLANW